MDVFLLGQTGRWPQQRGEPPRAWHGLLDTGQEEVLGEGERPRCSPFPGGFGWVPGFPGGSDGKESACNAGDLGWQDPLEEGMATPSSILAWRIPWTEEPGRLQSMVAKSWTRLSDEARMASS